MFGIAGFKRILARDKEVLTALSDDQSQYIGPDDKCPVEEDVTSSSTVYLSRAFVDQFRTVE